MRIAYTMNGLIGRFGGKHYHLDNTEKDNYKNESSLVLKYVNKSLKKYVLNNDVDIFIFSWETDKEKEFTDLLNPKKMKLVPQINFDPPAHLKGRSEKRVLAHYSRWYGFKEVMKLKSEYEKENNFKYDLVINARFDLCFNRSINFDNIDTNKFHIPELPGSNYGWPSGSPEILDHMFGSNSENMDKYSSLFDKLDEYTLPGECPQWNTISNHFLMVWHLNKLGLLDTDKTLKSFTTFETGAPDFEKGNCDYDILRYRNLTKENVMDEING
jgi:hypothetical protein